LPVGRRRARRASAELSIFPGRRWRAAGCFRLAPPRGGEPSSSSPRIARGPALTFPILLRRTSLRTPPYYTLWRNPCAPPLRLRLPSSIPEGALPRPRAPPNEGSKGQSYVAAGGLGPERRPPFNPSSGCPTLRPQSKGVDWRGRLPPQHRSGRARRCPQSAQGAMRTVLSSRDSRPAPKGALRGALRPPSGCPTLRPQSLDWRISSLFPPRLGWSPRRVSPPLRITRLGKILLAKSKCQRRGFEALPAKTGIHTRRSPRLCLRSVAMRSPTCRGSPS
jgi:hypothetical protein